jgi:hypothetical protein
MDASPGHPAADHLVSAASAGMSPVCGTLLTTRSYGKDFIKMPGNGAHHVVYFGDQPASFNAVRW